MSEKWEVQVEQVQDKFHVAPRRGLISLGNWPMLLPWWTRFLGGGNYRLMYPKTEKQLQRSRYLCAAVCELHNQRIEDAAATLERVKREDYVPREGPSLYDVLSDAIWPMINDRVDVGVVARAGYRLYQAVGLEWPGERPPSERINRAIHGFKVAMDNLSDEQKERITK